MANNEDEGRFDFAVDFEDVCMRYKRKRCVFCLVFVCFEWKFHEGTCIEFVGIYIYLYLNFSLLYRNTVFTIMLKYNSVGYI